MKNLVSLMVACAVSTPMFACFPAFADSIEHTSSSTSSSETIDVKKGVKFKFRERLHNIHAQIDTAVAKGWINGSQASGFRSEADALVRKTSSAEASGWPESEVDSLEKAVTKLNAALSTASTSSGSKASVSKAPAVKTVTKGSTTKKATVKVKKTTTAQ
ncbi:hypothetical protein KBI23_00410 [bacterium]|nr:hypothetical protein [bacterium]MBP9809101.1 hypothetical protein [bacterium]